MELTLQKYCHEQNIKKQLALLLNKHYDFYQSNKQNTILNHQTKDHYCINNGMHYILYIQSNKTKNILYFYPTNITDKTILTNYKITDYFLEMNQVFTDNYILSGYLYGVEDINQITNYTYLVDDILFKNDEHITMDYEIRNTLASNLIMCNKQHLQNINCNINIDIHPVFSNDKLINIFINNFKYKKSLKFIENKTLNTLQKINNNNINNQKCENVKWMTIKKDSEFPDVYYTIDENGNESLLYINGLKQSKYLNTLKYPTQLECTFNNNFYKWEIHPSMEDWQGPVSK